MGKTAALVVLVLAFVVGIPGRATAAPLGDHEDDHLQIHGDRRAAAADVLLRTATAPVPPPAASSPAARDLPTATAVLFGTDAAAPAPIAAHHAATRAVAATAATAAATAPTVADARSSAAPPLAAAQAGEARQSVPGDEHVVEGEGAAVLAPALQVEAGAPGTHPDTAVLGEQYERRATPSAGATRASRGPGIGHGLARTGSIGGTDDLLALGLGLVAIGTLLTRTSRARRGPVRSRQGPGRGSTPLTPGRTSERGRSRLH